MKTNISTSNTVLGVSKAWMMKVAALAAGHAPIAVAVMVAAEARSWPGGRLPIPRRALREAGIDRFGERRALRVLEEAALLRVERHGMDVVVQILDEMARSPKQKSRSAAVIETAPPPSSERCVSRSPGDGRPGVEHPVTRVPLIEMPEVL